MREFLMVHFLGLCFAKLWSKVLIYESRGENRREKVFLPPSRLKLQLLAFGYRFASLCSVLTKQFPINNFSSFFRATFERRNVCDDWKIYFRKLEEFRDDLTQSGCRSLNLRHQTRQDKFETKNFNESSFYTQIFHFNEFWMRLKCNCKVNLAYASNSRFFELKSWSNRQFNTRMHRNEIFMHTQLMLWLRRMLN